MLGRAGYVKAKGVIKEVDQFAADRDDGVPPHDVWKWEERITGESRRVVLHGDHFSVVGEPEALLAEIRTDLQRI